MTPTPRVPDVYVHTVSGAAPDVVNNVPCVYSESEIGGFQGRVTMRSGSSSDQALRWRCGSLCENTGIYIGNQQRGSERRETESYQKKEAKYVDSLTTLAQPTNSVCVAQQKVGISSCVCSARCNAGKRKG